MIEKLDPRRLLHRKVVENEPQFIAITEERLEEVKRQREAEKQQFLAEGSIEDLVRQGRTPFMLGEKALPLEEENLFFIPPEGFNERDTNNVENIFWAAGGVLAFKFKNNEQLSVADEVQLTREEAQLVNRRIIQEQNARIKL